MKVFARHIIVWISAVLFLSAGMTFQNSRTAHAGSTGKTLAIIGAAALIGAAIVGSQRQRARSNNRSRNSNVGSSNSSHRASYSQETFNDQQSLNTLGYPAGAADGKYGNKTRRAILQFQEANGYPKTGNLTSEQRIQLHQMASGNVAGQENQWLVRQPDGNSEGLELATNGGQNNSWLPQQSGYTGEAEVVATNAELPAEDELASAFVNFDSPVLAGAE